MTATFKLLKNRKQQKQKCKKKQKQTKNKKQKQIETKQNKIKQKQKQKEMKTHLTKNKVVQKSRFKASPVYTFISILTHVKE